VASASGMGLNGAARTTGRGSMTDRSPAPAGEPASLPENAFRELRPGEEYRPVVSAAESPPEVTFRSVAQGLLWSIVFSAAATYIALKLGQGIETAIPIAILAVGVSALLATALGRRASTLVENVNVLAVGATSGIVAGGSVSSWGSHPMNGSTPTGPDGRKLNALQFELMRGKVVTDRNTFASSVEGIFAVGDYVTGPATIIEAADLREADLRETRIIGYLRKANLAGALLSGADIGADPGNQSMGVMRAQFGNADLTGADLSGANLFKADFSYATLAGANLSHANLGNADLVQADFSRADLSDADLTAADIGGAIFTGARGIATVKGLDQTRNRELARFDP